MVGLMAYASSASGKPVTYQIDERGLRIEGVRVDCPMIYDNDWWFDTPDKNYLWAMASLGRANLRANIVTRDLWNWEKDYQYTLQEGLNDAIKSIGVARKSGVRNIPDAIAGCDRAFTRPTSGRIEDTAMVRSAGSDKIVEEAKKASPQRPLLVFVGGPLNTVANAVLMDPAIADRMVVFMTDLRGYNGKDPWANHIVAARCQLINYGAHVWWPQRPQPPVMPLERFAELPANEQTTDLLRIAKWFWERSTKKERPDRDDGFADGAPIFLVFESATWKGVVRQRVTGVFNVADVEDTATFDVLDARKLDYGAMTEAFFRTLKDPKVYAVPPVPEDNDETGFVDLFSVEALKNWRQCGPGKFSIEGGVATCEGGMGLWWYAGRTYGDFVLRGEFVQEHQIADSGVFVRFPDPEQDPWIAVTQGHEMEIGDPEPKDPTWRTGSIYPFCAANKVNTGPLGQWNRYEIACVGQRYLVRINGERVTDWTDPKQRTMRGYVGLQNYSDGKTVRHRNLRIKALDF